MEGYICRYAASSHLAERAGESKLLSNMYAIVLNVFASFDRSSFACTRRRTVIVAFTVGLK
jgi:hypothetical protein